MLMAPRLIELCFQTAGLWEMGVQGRMGLPLHVDRVCLWRAPDWPKAACMPWSLPIRIEESFDAEVVDRGKPYVHLTGYRTVALPNSVDAEPLKALRASARPLAVINVP